jgi:AcrR family transcriptional regulator
VVQRRRRLLDIDLILDTALALIDEHGRLTMTELAARLGTSASAVYHHVSGRAAIIELLRERIAGPLGWPPPESADWAVEIADWMRGYRRVMAEQPNVIPLLTAQTITSKPALASYDRVVDLLRASGFPAAELLLWVSVLDNFALGAALDAAAPDDVWRSDRRDTPALDDAVDAAPRGRRRADAAFELGLEAIVVGMRHRLRDRATLDGG